jgi:hypothetical protein
MDTECVFKMDVSQMPVHFGEFAKTNFKADQREAVAA